MKIDRRGFLRILTFVGVIGATTAYSLPLARYLYLPSELKGNMPKTLLVDENGTPLKASSLPVNKMFVFEYPLKGVINILINLGNQNGEPVEIKPLKVPLSMKPMEEPSMIFGGKKDPTEFAAENTQFYTFPGGTGPKKSIVAYNSICQHLGCIYPQLRYYEPGKPTEFNTNPPKVGERGAILFCKCHGSSYDPYRGGAVLTEPSLRPQPTIVLEWDKEKDYLYAVDVVGPVIFGKTCNTCGGELVGDKTVARKTW